MLPAFPLSFKHMFFFCLRMINIFLMFFLTEEKPVLYIESRKTPWKLSWHKWVACMWSLLWFFLKILVFSFFTVSFCICHCPVWGILSSLPYYSKSQEKNQPKKPCEKALASTRMSQAPGRALQNLHSSNLLPLQLDWPKNLGLLVQVSGCLSGVWIREQSGPFTPGWGRPKAAALEGKRRFPPAVPGQGSSPPAYESPCPRWALASPPPPVHGKAVSGSDSEYRQVQVPLKAGGLFGLSWWHFAFSDIGDAWHKKKTQQKFVSKHAK